MFEANQNFKHRHFFVSNKRLLLQSTPCYSLNLQLYQMGHRFCYTLNQRIRMEQPNKRAVIYARVSSQNDRQDTTRQIMDLEKYAIGQDVKIEKIYEEHISGAKKNEERRILQDCLEYCISNSIDYLYLSEISRLGRSTLQVLRSLEKLHEAKVSVFIENLGIYSLMEDGKVNPIASILITVLAEMSNIERSNIQYRLNSGRQQYINKGGKLGRKVGFRKTNDQLKEEYKNVIAMLKKGYSVRAIAKLENISPTTVQKIKNSESINQAKSE